jgi:protein-disulfide isomerase
VVDGARALEGAKELGFAREKMIEAANAETITDAMKAHVRLGDRLQMEATPSLVVQDVAIVGYPGRAAMETIVGAVRQCGRAAC